MTPEEQAAQKAMQEMAQKSRMILEALNQQRKGAVNKLEERIQGLLDSNKLNVEHLKNPELVNTLREIVQSLNSALLALSSHDKLIDLLIRDLTGTYTLTQNLQEGTVQTSLALEAVAGVLLEKELVTQEELVNQENKVKERIRAMREAAEKQASQGPPVEIVKP